MLPGWQLSVIYRFHLKLTNYNNLLTLNNKACPPNSLVSDLYTIAYVDMDFFQKEIINHFLPIEH